MMFQNINKIKLKNSKYNWIDTNIQLPDVDTLVIVGWIQCINSIWNETKITIAKYDGYRWIDCLNLYNMDLIPLYWAELPDLFEEE